MTVEEIKSIIKSRMIIAVVRMKNAVNLLKVVEAIIKGGVGCIELTMTIPNAIELMERTVKEFGNDILLGAGSVINRNDAVKSMDSGAKFVVSPVFNEEIVRTVKEKELVSIPAGFTPTEIQNAHEAGADFVKVFPADKLGMSYIKSIKAPLQHLEIIPIGGVTLDNADEWIEHGASAVGVGSALVNKEAVEDNDYGQLTKNAERICQNLGIE